jgi:amino-acid N-acetyltransferase
MQVRTAVATDLAQVERLLDASDLPTDGVRDNFSNFIVADDQSTIAGAIGFEKYGSAALLRSAVVAPDYRGSGLGRRLVEQLLKQAEAVGVVEIYLLTTTAEEYFPRFGFTHTTRAAVPDAVRTSVEFRGACPDTAAVMMRRIGDERTRA